MRGRLAAVIGACLVQVTMTVTWLEAANSQESATVQQAFRRTVKAGRMIILAPGITNVRSSTDCTFVPIDLNVVVEPRRGRVASRLINRRRSDIVLASGPLNANACANRVLTGLRITYQANARAHGSDEVLIRISQAGSSVVGVARYRIGIR
jgi:hypothetical protein